MAVFYSKYMSIILFKIFFMVNYLYMLIVLSQFSNSNDLSFPSLRFWLLLMKIGYPSFLKSGCLICPPWPQKYCAWPRSALLEQPEFYRQCGSMFPTPWNFRKLSVPSWSILLLNWIHFSTIVGSSLTNYKLNLLCTFLQNVSSHFRTTAYLCQKISRSCSTTHWIHMLIFSFSFLCKT